MRPTFSLTVSWPGRADEEEYWASQGTGHSFDRLYGIAVTFRLRAMRAGSQVTTSVFGIAFVLMLAACAGSESGTERSAEQAPEGSVSSSAAGGSDVGSSSSGDCGTIGQNLTYDELKQVSLGDDTMFHLPEDARNLVASTPTGGQQQYLDDSCELMVNAGMELGIPMEGIQVESYRDSPKMQADMIGAGYNFCTGYEGSQNWDPNSTFEPDSTQYGINDSFVLANKNLCPQVKLPKIPS